MGLISRVSSRTYRESEIMAYSGVAQDDRTFRGLSVHEDEGRNFYDEGPDVPFNTSQVESLTRSGNNGAALQNGLDQLLRGFPLDKNARTAAAACVINSMTLMKQNEITSFAESKSIPELDMLMKLVYKGFELNNNIRACGALINWHAAIEAKAGVGSIMRTMSNPRKL